MATKYRNSKTGRVVSVPDEAPTRTKRPMRSKQWAQNLERIVASKRWQRVADNTKLGMPKNRPVRRNKKIRTHDDAPPEPTGQTGDGGKGDGDGGTKEA